MGALADGRLAAASAAMRRTLAILVVSATAFVLLGLLVMAETAALVRLDTEIYDRALALTADHPAWLAVMRQVTRLGGAEVLVPLDVLAVTVCWWLGQRRAAAFAALAVLLTSISTPLIKVLVARPRPVDRLWVVEDLAFPSGHASNSAASAIVLSVLVVILARRRSGRAWIVVAAAGALAVATTRIMSGVHWPSDIIGGWLLAVSCVAAAALLCRPTRRPTTTR